MKTLKTATDLCTGCRLCMLACSFSHEQAFSEQLARLQLQADELRWHFEPVVCRQCADVPCVEACPSSALVRSAETGGLQVDPDACSGCGSCVEACRYGAIVFNEDSNVAQPCDLCGGSPECALICPRAAIQYTE